MANIQKPDMTNIWASEGVRVEPTEAKQLEGWVVEPPPHQWENWSQWRQDSALAHIFQKGVPLWDDKTSFHEGGSSYVQGSDGKIYISLQRSGGSVAARNPVTAGNKAFWKVAFTTSDERIAQSRITNLTSDLGNKASTSYVNTELGKKLTKSSNLSDLTNVTTARTNLGLGSSSVYPINDSVTLDSSVSVASSKAVKTLNDSKANKTTKVIAGTGLTGGGDLSSDKTFNVSYGVVANTAAQGNDSRLSDSREWTADTVNLAEAEAGISTTRRAWTSQRVRQAVVAWFNGVSGALGRTILTRTSAAQVRGDIGLGTAATRDAGTASGNVMEVGSFGLGSISSPSLHLASNSPSSFFNVSGLTVPNEWGQGGGTNNENTGGILLQRGERPTALFFGNRLELKMSRHNGTAWSPAVSIYHTGNMSGSIGHDQIWRNVSSSRSLNTTYMNTTGRSIEVKVWSLSGNSRVLIVNGVQVETTRNGEVSSSIDTTIGAIVPSGASYRVDVRAENEGGNTFTWLELR